VLSAAGCDRCPSRGSGSRSDQNAAAVPAVVHYLPAVGGHRLRADLRQLPVTAVVRVLVGPVDEDAAEFAGLSCAGASGRELLVVGLVDLVVGVLIGAVDEDLAGLNSGVGGVACQGLVGGLVEGLMEVIVRFLVGAVDGGAAQRAAVQRPLGGILSESRRSLVSVMPRSLRVFGRLDSSAAANPSLASSWSACLNPVARASTGSPDGRRLLRSPHVPWRPRWSCAVVAPPSGDGRISD
jgi:hypothetical protein